MPLLCETGNRAGLGSRNDFDDDSLKPLARLDGIAAQELSRRHRTFPLRLKRFQFDRVPTRFDQQPPRLDFFNENVFYHEVNIPAYPLFQHAPYESALASEMEIGRAHV